MVIYRRCSWGEGKTLLEGPGRVQDRVVVNVERLEVEWNVSVGIGVHGILLLPWMVERIFAQSRIPIWVIGYHNTIRWVYLGRKLGRPFSRLSHMVSSFTAQDNLPQCKEGTLVSSMLVFLTLRCT